MPEAWGPVSVSALAGVSLTEVEGAAAEGNARGILETTRSWERGREGWWVEGASIEDGD